MNSKSPINSYISLFSSGGIGDIGFRDEEFFCVASAELLSRRIEVQRINKIAEESRLICGDLMQPGHFKKVLRLASEFTQAEQQPITTIIATPPCQGMSVANHKKKNELARNSLVVRSIEIIRAIQPLTFVFENVPAFMKTTCTGTDGIERTIGQEIEKELGGEYEYYSTVLQFSEFGSPSSRKRSLTIGVRNDVTWVTPLDLFPQQRKPKTLKEVIGHLPSLEIMGECSSNDLLHAFRPYEQRMRPWISDLKPGQSAFDNVDPRLRPHRIIDGQIVPNAQKNGDKYKRLRWDSIPPCVHTRNDILASQNTIHPEDDRVFSIRELMLMMGVPEDFSWFEGQKEAQTRLDVESLKKHAINIRQCLGEAIPVPITQAIAKNIKIALTSLLTFSKQQPKRSANISSATPAQKAAYFHISEQKKKQFSAYYTEPLVAFSVIKRALENKKIGKRGLRVLEPSAGTGVFVHTLSSFAVFNDIELIAYELDTEIYPRLLESVHASNNFSKIAIHNEDFLSANCESTVDLIIGNPPFGRKKTEKESLWNDEPELSVRFLNKALSMCKSVNFILPKSILHAAYYRKTREMISKSSSVSHILDFGEFTFPGVKIETLGLCVTDQKKDSRNSTTKIKSWIQNSSIEKPSLYVMDDHFPTWTIYRNDSFDNLIQRLQLGAFMAWRDRRISRKFASATGTKVIRGKNIANGGNLSPAKGDYLIKPELAAPIRNTIDALPGNTKLLVPNLTYKPRATLYSPDSGIPEGSCAVLYGDLENSQIQSFIEFSSSKEFEEFYRIACNRATRSINIDSCLVFWWGVPS